MVLAHDVVIAAGAEPERSFVLLHGILGTGPNLRTIARRFVEERPAWAAILVDLRRHGGSLDVSGPDTLEQAALDVAELARTLEHPARAVLGHSFGGKVALQWLAAQGEASALEHTFVIDSNPGPRPDARGSEGTLRVIDAVGSLPYPFPTRAAFVTAMTERHGRTIAAWLAMNLRQAEDGWRFGPPIESIRALLSSYFAVDLWPIVESPPDDAHVHLVIGDRSTVLDAADRERATAIAARLPDRVTVDLLPTDHWVHVEDPDGLLRALLARVHGP